VGVRQLSVLKLLMFKPAVWKCEWCGETRAINSFLLCGRFGFFCLGFVG